MTLFEEIVLETSLLTEGVSVDSIRTAIRGLHPVWITYDDQKGGKGKARRLIYPVAYGKTSAGNPVVRAFQPQGSSKRGLTTPPNDREKPKWKYFRVDRIKFWRTINSNIYNTDELVGFNEDGDKSMSEVYEIAPIGNAKNIKRNNIETNNPSGETPTKSFEPKPITKDEVENINIPQTTETPNKQKYTAKNAIDSIIGFIKNGFKKTKNLFTKKLENNSENPNIKTGDTINAPDTKPVTKQEIGDSDEQQINQQTNTQQNKPVNDEPVTKDEIENNTNTGEENETHLKENVLTKSFNDMMNRINKLEK